MSVLSKSLLVQNLSKIVREQNNVSISFNKSSRVESYQCVISLLINRTLESVVSSKFLLGFLVIQKKKID